MPTRAVWKSTLLACSLVPPTTSPVFRASWEIPLGDHSDLSLQSAAAVDSSASLWFVVEEVPRAFSLIRSSSPTTSVQGISPVSLWSIPPLLRPELVLSVPVPRYLVQTPNQAPNPTPKQEVRLRLEARHPLELSPTLKLEARLRRDHPTPNL